MKEIRLTVFGWELVFRVFCYPQTEVGTAGTVPCAQRNQARLRE